MAAMLSASGSVWSSRVSMVFITESTDSERVTWLSFFRVSIIGDAAFTSVITSFMASASSFMLTRVVLMLLMIDESDSGKSDSSDSISATIASVRSAASCSSAAFSSSERPACFSLSRTFSIAALSSSIFFSLTSSMVFST